MVKPIKPILSKGGISLKYQPEHIKYIERIKKLFITEYYGFNNTIRISRSYRLYKNYNLIVLPKFGFIHYLKDSYTKRSFNKLGIYSEEDIRNRLTLNDESDADDFTWEGKSNSYQELVIDYVMQNYFSTEKINNGMAGVILKLPTGQGKTFVAMRLINEIKIPTLFICPTKKIANQVRQLMIKMFPRLEIGIYHSDIKIDGDIIVGVIDSFANSKEFIFREKIETRKYIYSKYSPEDFFSRWKFIIFDECHNYCTEKNSQIFSRISTIYTLGLSATPDIRKDSFDIMCQWHIGPILSIDDIPNYLSVYKEEEDSSTFRGKVIGIKYYGPDDYTNNLLDRKGHIIPYKMLEQLMSDPYRIKLIINEICELLKNNYCILIFADRISYLRILKKNLNDTTKLSESTRLTECTILDDIDKKILNSIKVTGGATDNEMLLAHNKSNVIFTTYPFFKEGISMPRINAIIYATPRKHGYEQTNGRCIRPSKSNNINQRKKEDEKERIIIDIIDWKVKIKSQWYTRKKSHEKMNDIGANFEIIMKNVNYEDY